MTSNVSDAINQFFEGSERFDTFTLSSEEIEELFSRFPFQLSEEIHDFYLLTNGLNLEEKIFFGFARFFNLATSIMLYEKFVTRKNYKPNWFPLGSCEDATLIIIGEDKNQTAAPIFWIYLSDLSISEINLDSIHILSFPSLTGLLVLAKECER
ncbi:SMI1/KNR4 family protein [Pseudanabaenaceae cyanobacterium LEGE 13415]|nr:SMI1/KNR4 family protein [Pseudanabaenaceae cyanobacterium LEGE 13415]